MSELVEVNWTMMEDCYFELIGCIGVQADRTMGRNMIDGAIGRHLT